MTDKRRILVFLGAPNISPSADACPGTEPGPWRTAELHLQGGVLQLKNHNASPEGRDCILRGQSSPGCFSLPDDDISQSNMHTNAAQHKCTRLSQAEEDATRAEPASDTVAQNKLSGCDEQEVCPHAVREYLDNCFSNSETGPTSAQLGELISTETEYLSVWTLSQALALKGQSNGQLGMDQTDLQTPTPVSTLELYSPESGTSGKEGRDSQQDSHWLLDTLSRRQEEGGVQLEATPEGVLCSQRVSSKSEVGAEDQLSDLWTSSAATTINTAIQTFVMPPAPKKSRSSPPQDRRKDDLGQTGRTFGMAQNKPTTLLAQCMDRKLPYSILVAVLYPCHLKEVGLKSGAWAGSTVPLASIVVTDQSGVEMKVVLWRSAAFWALTVYPGDVLLITDVMVNEDKWRGEVVLQSTRSTTLLNLGHLSSVHTPGAVPHGISSCSLRTLYTHLKEKHRLLLALPPRACQNQQHISHVYLKALKPDTLVHAVLRVTSITTVTDWCTEVAGFSRTGGVQKATLTVQQRGGQQRVLVLWGAAMAWLPRIKRNKDAVWEFRVLLVKQNVSSGCLELHSTPWGSCKPLFPNDKTALQFCSNTHSNEGPLPFDIDLQTLLSQKYTGDVELRCHISGFHFQSTSSHEASLLMNSDTPFEGILDAFSGDVTFTGCGRCGSELTTDVNGIYRPCYPCLPYRSVCHYYRPAVLTVKEKDSEIHIQVPPVLVQKILQNVSPEKLNHTVAPASSRKFVHMVADTLHSLLTNPQDTVVLTVHSHFQCDENSVPTAQDFLLLEFQP